MSGRISVAEAKRLGLLDPQKKRTTRKGAVSGPFNSRCMVCQEEFTTIAAEDRHLLATKHGRYEVIFPKGTT